MYYLIDSNGEILDKDGCWYYSECFLDTELNLGEYDCSYNRKLKNAPEDFEEDIELAMEFKVDFLEMLAKFWIEPRQYTHGQL